MAAAGDATSDAGAHAQAIDAAYERDQGPAPSVTTLGGYAKRWPTIRPRATRTNGENTWRIGAVLAMEIEGRELRDWPIAEIRRKHPLAGATGILRAMSAIVNDAFDDEECGANVWLRLGVKRNDPRVQKQPRPKRLWTMEQMHAFAAAAAGRDTGRDELTELERWRAVYAGPMLRVLSDCGPRLGELLAAERAHLRPGWVRFKQTAHEGRVHAGTKTTHHRPEDEQWREVPLPPSTEALLRAMPPRIDTPTPLPDADREVWRERNWRRDVWAPSQKAAGIDPRPLEFRASW